MVSMVLLHVDARADLGVKEGRDDIHVFEVKVVVTCND